MTFRKVLVTGDTGFTGNWLVPQLLAEGFEVHGFSDRPSGVDNLFPKRQSNAEFGTTFGDIRDFAALSKCLNGFEPDYVVHLAAQPLVIPSYQDPAETMTVNIVGTINVLEAALRSASVKGVLAITSDKVYAPTKDVVTETSPIFGDDPYSASKSASENVIMGYRRLFEKESKGIVVIRGGNIIGGGDYSMNRIVPDAIRAWRSGESLELRNPAFVRPWQHVYDLTRSYVLALRFLEGQNFVYEALNVGPSENDSLRSVRDVIDRLFLAGIRVQVNYSAPVFHESEVLRINSDKATKMIGWRPKVGFEAACRLTGEWYVRVIQHGEKPLEVTEEQLRILSNS